MGGLAGGRYIGPRGTTTGDVTGGGGRSVMPNRDFLNMLAARRRRMMAPRAAPPARYPREGYGPLVPPGGWQGGGQMRYGFEQSGNYPWMPQSWRDRVAGLRTSVSGRSLPSYLQQFQTRSGPNVTDILKEQPAWWPESARGWRAWQIPRRGIEGHSVGVAPTGTRNLSGSGGRGGYSGGVVPRFQAGGVPVGGGYGEYVKGFLGKTSGPGMREWDRDRANKASHIQQAQRNLAPPRGRGGYSGGVIPRFQAGGGTRPKLLPADASWPLPPGLNYDFVGARRQQGAESIAERMANQARRRASRSPGGWQEGGQLEEPLFPVESELADESPWYPDEEVGYEEEFPTQGGFDIFGRSGG